MRSMVQHKLYTLTRKKRKQQTHKHKHCSDVNKPQTSNQSGTKNNRTKNIVEIKKINKS